ncbi:DUF6520 family protein [Kaistella palustris]|uniref:DUF6520 family protein n=1 Tax=Kaistella palustris TaxID=493376 RepID=UPI000483B042|nr:DUF6520 family protein [Kaistella palustris]
MKKLIIPAILVSLGTGAAFATPATGSDSTTPAFRIVSVGPNQTVCVDAQQDCTTAGADICTWSVDGTTPLHQFDTPTMCGELLYKVPQP